MMEKISFKGDDMHPIYQWLTQKAQNGVMDSEVGWNFQKYMIDEDGQLVGFLKPRETVDAEKLISWLEE
jgi:glutathione peroxidase